MTNFFSDTICSLSTPLGMGAIAVIRVSGPDAFTIVNYFFRGNDILANAKQKIFYGDIIDQDAIIDEVLLTVFRAPHSFTRQNTVEISCHNSTYILKTILTLLQNRGARLAKPGEFTQRAFLNGRFDLAQAEAIAELIASDSKAAHQTAMKQMRGGFSNDIKVLRNKLIDFASLLELELDFGEEDVEFAKRDELKSLVNDIQHSLLPLLKSFQLGNTLKDGIPTVIAGKPNAGKSTLLNVLLNEERAIVSDIPGTTRDTIEDEFMVEGIKFRLIDTAGLRETKDTIEAIGVARTYQKMKQASLIIYLFDPLLTSALELKPLKLELDSLEVPYLLVGNKLDVLSLEAKRAFDSAWPDIIWISASHQLHLASLVEAMVLKVQGDQLQSGHTIITNVRHYEHLKATYDALTNVAEKIDRFVTSDWLALDIREAMNHLGEITGEITTDDLLTNIFSRFCIGK